MKILVLLAKGFEMMEFAPFVDVMGWGRNNHLKHKRWQYILLKLQ